MIVNFQDFHFFLKKISNSLGSFDEVIFPYPANPERQDIVFFRFAKPDEHKNLELNYPSTIDLLKILFDHSCEKAYPQRDNSAKRLIPGVIADIKKAWKVLLEIISKGIQRL